MRRRPRPPTVREILAAAVDTSPTLPLRTLSVRVVDALREALSREAARSVAVPGPMSWAGPPRVGMRVGVDISPDVVDQLPIGTVLGIVEEGPGIGAWDVIRRASVSFDRPPWWAYLDGGMGSYRVLDLPRGASAYTIRSIGSGKET